MAIIYLKGRITEDRQLQVELPDDAPIGEVDIALKPTQEDLPWELQPWTEKEWEELTRFKPATGAEIADMLEATDGWWEDMGITDSVAWVEEQRRKRRKTW